MNPVSSQSTRGSHPPLHVGVENLLKVPILPFVILLIRILKKILRRFSPKS